MKQFLFFAGIATLLFTGSMSLQMRALADNHYLYSVVDIGWSNGQYSGVTAINNSGTVVGSATDLTGHRGAFKWTSAAGMMPPLQDFVGHQSTANGISDSGVICGRVEDSS